jgi:hypothetical protein
MLHLSAVAGDAACATHGANGHHQAPDASAVAEHSAAMHGHEMATAAHVAISMSSARPIVKSSAPPCEVPTQQHCCDALVGCSVDSATASGPEVMTAAISPATRIRVALVDVPASFASAPEPPPPKA